MKHPLRTLAFIIIVIGAVAVSGCATPDIKPWQRGALAKPEMAWDPNGATAGMLQHVYFSKEASTGGANAGGGGCGCN